ncbi:MAG: alpha/beta fold hydrolase [Balneolaceae bacterium]
MGQDTNYNRWIRFALLLFILGSVAACDVSDDGSGSAVWSTLSSYSVIGELTREEIIEVWPDLGPLATFLAYDVTAYRLNYRTTGSDGRSLLVSGLVLNPNRTRPPLLSLHRGTIFHESEAPSRFNPDVPNANTGWTHFGPAAASMGYLTIMPDLIGFGTSSQSHQAYLIRRLEGGAAYDMLRAVMEFAEDLERDVAPGLYVTGYSQGGNTALALLDRISEDPSSRFNVTKATAGGAALDLEGTAIAVLEQDQLSSAPFYTLLVYSILQAELPLRPVTSIFATPWSEEIGSGELFGGDLTRTEVSDRLTNQTSDLFLPLFRSQFLGQGEQEIKNVLRENSLHNSPVEGPLRLFHGTEDEIIPYEVAAAAATSLEQAGSTDLTFHPVPDGTHATAAETYLEETIRWFLGL